MPKSRRPRRSDDLVHKQLLKFKAIVALILKLCCPEFRNLPLREIEQRIEMPSDLGQKPVHASPFIRGENIEVTDDETQTLFDSLFTAKSDFGILRVKSPSTISGPPTLVKQDVKVFSPKALRERECALAVAAGRTKVSHSSFAVSEK